MIFNYIRDLQAAGKKEKDDDRIVLNRNILTQNCSNLLKGIKDKIFFYTVLAHTCTIQSRIRPKNTMVHFTGILLSYKKTTELCCYLVSKGPRCPNLATELVLCRVYICNCQLIIPPLQCFRQ